jgi:hypothetical protein
MNNDVITFGQLTDTERGEWDRKCDDLLFPSITFANSLWGTEFPVTRQELADEMYTMSVEMGVLARIIPTCSLERMIEVEPRLRYSFAF